MQKLEKLYEGKAKMVFRTDDPELLIVNTRMMPPPLTAKNGAPSPEKASSTTG